MPKHGQILKVRESVRDPLADFCGSALQGVRMKKYTVHEPLAGVVPIWDAANRQSLGTVDADVFLAAAFEAGVVEDWLHQLEPEVFNSLIRCALKAQKLRTARGRQRLEAAHAVLLNESERLGVGP